MSEQKYRRIIAVDFDGTLAKTRFPEILAPIPEMIEYCRQLQENGAVLILYTCRKGKDLSDAVEWSRRQGIVFDYVNENTAENIANYGGEDTRKIFAHEYIDDRAVNPDYIKLRNMLAHYEEAKRAVEKRIQEIKDSTNYPHNFMGQMVEDFEWVLKLLEP